MIKLLIERHKSGYSRLKVAMFAHISPDQVLRDELLFKKIPEQRLTKYGIIYKQDYNAFLKGGK
jgi:hypothetical protein